MKITEVDGNAVIAIEAVESPLSTPERPVMFSRINRLLLANDTVVYGCAVEDCGYAADAVGQVRSHLRVHRKPRKAAVVAKAKHADADALDASDMTIRQLLALADANQALNGTVSRLIDDRNEWKTRARKAEGSLALMRKALS
jgi:hypothetical protein